MVIYDFGMNNGDDTEYYLKKGRRVVAVEANPQLCELCHRRFKDEVADGRLVILNAALSGSSSDQTIPFFVHKWNHVLSRVEPPTEERADEFERITVPRARASDIIRAHGHPHYIKIDLEGMDDVVLSDIFASGCFPEYISAEILSVTPFALMVANGYKAFNLVDGPTVSKRYGAAIVATPSGDTAYSFLPHSAGPFGQDIATPWWDADSFFRVLAAEGLGWKDVHASMSVEPRHRFPEFAPPDVKSNVRGVLQGLAHRFNDPKGEDVPSDGEADLRAHLGDLVPSVVRAFRRRLLKRMTYRQLAQ